MTRKLGRLLVVALVVAAVVAPMSVASADVGFHPRCAGIDYNAADPYHILYPTALDFNVKMLVDQWELWEARHYGYDEPTALVPYLNFNMTDVSDVVGAPPAGGHYVFFWNDVVFGDPPLDPTNINIRIVGTPYDDIICGSPTHDVIKGQGGDDYIVGGRFDIPTGWDALWDNDIITGGPGDDVMIGGWGWDAVEGRSGNDTAFGVFPPTDVVLPGGPYPFYLDLDRYDGWEDEVNRLDTIPPADHYNDLWGGKGTDTLYAGDTFDDRLVGGPGADLLVGGDEDNELYGQGGNDTMYGMANDDVFFGGAGDDVMYGNCAGMTADLIGPCLLDDDGEESMYGGGGNDTMVGAGSGDDIYGGGGNDTIWGLGGYDDLRGNGGDDMVYGTSSLTDAASVTAGIAIDSPDGGNGIMGGPGNDVLYGAGSVDDIRGGAGADDMVGGSGNDYMEGGTNDDWMSGGLGNDELFGEAGDDELYGGDGADYLVGGAGYDDLFGEAGDDDIFGDDVVPATTDGADWISGGGGSDELIGGNGPDVLYGDAGDDFLTGGPWLGDWTTSNPDAAVDDMYGGLGGDTYSGAVADLDKATELTNPAGETDSAYHVPGLYLFVSYFEVVVLP